MYDRMREDPFTAAAIDAITALKAATRPGRRSRRASLRRRPTAAPVRVRSADRPGTERDVHDRRIPRRSLLAAGAERDGRHQQRRGLDLAVRRPTGEWTSTTPDGFHEVCGVEYLTLGDRIRMEMVVGCSDNVDFRWQLDGDQFSVTVVPWDGLSQYDLTVLQAIFGGPWTKVE